MPTIRVMVVDDHEVVRTGLKAILEPEGDLEVVGEAGSAGEAVQKVPRLTPDVILMDVRMGEVSGIEACRLIKSAHPRTHVLIPNPPKDTDGRREGSGRGWVRELQGRWPGVLG